MKKLLLVDGHSLIYRSYFAFIRQPLRNSKGQNTSAVYGFANTLKKMLQELKPGHCAVVFDAPGRTFRHDRYDKYKIQRPPPPDELPDQIPPIKEMVTAWGLTAIEVPGVEADDVLGTLAVRFAGEGFDVTIATTDKDMLQLVGARLSVYDPWKTRRYRSTDVEEKLGVSPGRVVDFLALTGDPIDNVPGVSGIGPKRARAIIERHGSLEDALMNEPRLRGHEEVARMSRDLVRIDTAVDVAPEPADLEVRDPNSNALRRLFQELEFASLLRDLAPQRASAVSVVEVRDAGIGVEQDRFAFRFASSSGLWFADAAGSTRHVPTDRIDVIRSLLETPRLLKIGLAVKEQFKTVSQAGVQAVGPFFDVSVGAWLVDPNRRSYALEDLGLQLLGRPILPAGLEGEPELVLQLHDVLDSQIAAMGLESLLTDLEMPLIPVLADMERRGIKVDTEFLGTLGRELQSDCERVAQEIWKSAGTEFNIASPKQLSEVLFDRLGMPAGKTTKTGYSTSASVLEDLAERYPIVQQVLRYRELSKLQSTYVKPLVRHADSETSRVHACFNQTGTATGRLSSSDPNLQNIPIRTEAGRRLRRAFVADEGKVLISADYSQIELRVLAHMSGDAELQSAFSRGDDVHASTAAAVFEVEPTQVSPEQRRLAKVVNYGLLYGMGDFGMSWRMGVPREQARSFVEEYMSHYAGVAAWRDTLVAQAEEEGFVRTLAGRIRPVPGILSRNRNVAEAARRAALNAPIQGTAADIVKKAMLVLHERLAAEGIEGGMLAQIHDELLFEVALDDAERATAAIREDMERAANLCVPLVVEIGTGRSWDEAH